MSSTALSTDKDRGQVFEKLLPSLLSEEDEQNQSSSTCENCESLYKITWKSNESLLGYFSLGQSGGDFHGFSKVKLMLRHQSW